MSGKISLTYGQTSAIRTAVDLVIAEIGGEKTDRRRRYILNIVIGVATETNQYDAPTLAKLAVEKLSGLTPEPT